MRPCGSSLYKPGGHALPPPRPLLHRPDRPPDRRRRRLGGDARALGAVAARGPLQAHAHGPITPAMKSFLNLRVSARLGAAFGFLVLALLVIALVGLNSVG